MRQLWSVTRFEFSSYAKNKTFVGMTIFLMVLALVGPAIPVIFNAVSGMTGERTIAVVDNTGRFSADVVGEFIVPRATFFTDINDAIYAIESGEHNYAIEISEDGFVMHVSAMGVGVANIQNQAAAMLRHAHRIGQMEQFGLTAAQAGQILMFEPNISVLTIGDMEADAGSFFENVIYAYAMAVVLLIGLQMGGAHLLTTVVREKSTKTMELLVTSCHPSKMLNGKVLGVGAALMTQILLLVLSAFASMQILPRLTEGMDVFTISISPSLLVYLVVFFLLGFLTYAYTYAALASTASRQEDALSMGQLPQLLLTAGFFASMIGMNNPGAAWVMPLSHVPFISPFLMFMRITMGSAANWEIAVSIATQIITIGIVSWMGSKIYRMGTLMYGAKPTFKNLLEAFK